MTDRSMWFFFVRAALCLIALGISAAAIFALIWAAYLISHL